MVRVMPAGPDHLAALTPRDGAYAPGIKPLFSEPAFAFFNEGVLIAVIGAVINTGCGSLWGVLSERVLECPVAFHRAVLRLGDSFQAQYSLRRMQMTVRKGYRSGWRWAVALGFECEGTLRKFETDGCDAWLFSRVT